MFHSMNFGPLFSETLHILIVRQASGDKIQKSQFAVMRYRNIGGHEQNVEKNYKFFAIWFRGMQRLTYSRGKKLVSYLGSQIPKKMKSNRKSK